MSTIPASEARLRTVPWGALSGLGPALQEPIARVLAGSAAERVLDRLLRDHRDLRGEQRAAIAEAIFGVGIWRRRLRFHLGRDDAPPLHLLASLLRDVAGIDADEAERLAAAGGALPPPRPPPRELALRFSLPDWLAETLAREAGAEAEALADALGTPGPICLRPNSLRTTPEALASRLGAEGVATRPGALVPSALVVTSPRPNLYGLAAMRDGLAEVQDEGSQLLGALLRASPGESVLDLCAGAGGKALQLAAAVGRGGAVHATDLDRGRLDRLIHRARRAGASAIVQVHGEVPPPGLLVDAALVDAPCSELGVLRRGPDVRFRLDPRDFEALPAVQRSLLDRAAGHVRAGGRLAYATCTLRREENEDVALAFERGHPEFAREPVDLPARAGADGGFLRTWPHRHGCDGFFAASWRRRRA